MDNKEEKYLDELDFEINDDFDVEIKPYFEAPSFIEFVKKPFGELSNFKPIMCKTGQIKLPKEIIEHYIIEKNWDFENYHAMELLALLYLLHYKDNEEWKNQKILDEEFKSILDALPHFKSINELLMYSIHNGDLKSIDLDQVIESDEQASYEVTGLDDIEEN